MAKLIALVAVLLASLTLFVQLRSRPTDDPPPTVARTEGSPAPREEVSQASTVSARRSLPPSVEPRLGAAEEVTAPTSLVPSSDDELSEQLEQDKVERASRRTSLDSRLASESREPSWAAAVEDDVRASVARFDTVATLTSVECRKTMCALVMSHSNIDSQRQSMNDLAGAPGFRLAGTAHLEYSADQGATTYVYLSRSGDFFPRD